MRQAKWGRTECGSQKHHCPACHKVYVAAPRVPGYPPSVRQQAVRMSLDGINQRRIGRLLSVNHQSVANWLKAYHERRAAQTGQAQTGQAQTGQAQTGQAQTGQAQTGQAQTGQAQTGQAQTVELDELYTFVGSKKAASTSARRWTGPRTRSSAGQP